MVKTRVDAGGRLEGINEDGTIAWVEKRRRDDAKPVIKEAAPRRKSGRKKMKDRGTHHWVIDGDGKKRWVPIGTDPHTLPFTHFPYNQVSHDAITLEIMAGRTMLEISKMEGFPTLRAMQGWLIKYEDFRRDMDKAREIRAGYYHDSAIDKAEKVKKNTVAQTKLQVDTYKWAAEKGDPSRYGNQTKIVGDPDRPVQILVETGIREAVIEQKPKEIDVDED